MTRGRGGQDSPQNWWHHLWTAPYSILVFYFMTSNLWSRSPAPHTLTILQSENANLDFEAKRKKQILFFLSFLPPWSCLLSAHGRPKAKSCSTWPRLRDESFYLWLGPLPPHGIVGPGCILGENIWTFPSLSFFTLSLNWIFILIQLLQVKDRQNVTHKQNKQTPFQKLLIFRDTH